MARFNFDNAQLEEFRDITDDVVESDFVPYACLFDPQTILTKNGELLQIIKITGFTYEALEHADADLRHTIRKAVMATIPGPQYALWFTTIRRKKNLSPDGKYPDAFSQQMHEAWRHRNAWDRKYMNELYITIVREGQDVSISNPNGFFSGLIGNIDRAVRNAFLERIAGELNETVGAMLSVLEEYGARRLTVVKRGDVYYGEHLEFLEKLINLEERPMPLAEIGLADYLTSGEITFAYNAMEVRSAEGDRRFGAVLTIKEYKEASNHRLDELLQLPYEFIATQCVDFIDAEKARNHFKEQLYFLKVSGERELAVKNELLATLDTSDAPHLGFGEQQTTLFVIATSVQELEQHVKAVRKELSRIGIVSIREDMFFEDGYWSMLPANFPFIARLNYTNVKHIAGLVNLQNYPAGNAAGCPWGPPVTVFYTAAGTPYFFNFHLGEAGHTAVVGPFGSGKSVLLNFLLSEARKYQNRLFYLDCHGNARRFIEAIGGNYYGLESSQILQHALSPLSLPDSPANRAFLSLWLKILIDPFASFLNANQQKLIDEAVAAVFAGKPEERRLGFIAGHIAPHDYELSAAFSKWYGKGEYAGYFDHMADKTAPANGIIGFDLSPLMDVPELLLPIVSYLLHRITSTLDGTPSIIVLDEGWRLLNNPMFAGRHAKWLDYLTQKNALAVLTTEEVEEAAAYAFSSEIIGKAVSQIYLPDDDPSEAYEEAFGLNADEIAYLEAMNPQYRHFMLKRKNETIIAELNLGGMDELLAVLSGSAAPEDIADESEDSGSDIGVS